MEEEVRNAFGRVIYRIGHDAAADVVEAHWQGAATAQNLQDPLLVGLRVHERTRCAYRLNDNTAFSGPWAHAVPWLEQEWLPRAHAAGVRCLAHVARSGAFGEQAGEALLQDQIGAQIRVAVFGSRADALAWLGAQQRERAVRGRFAGE